MFGSKEKKLKKAQAEAEARENAEFEARYTAKQERKNVERMIAELDKNVQGLLLKAADAKKKGQAVIYRNYVTAIKIARARKQQAENFLAQVDVMQQMQSITKSSKELLSSMGAIMGSLGKLTIDRDAMMESQRSFQETQRELDKQGMTLENFLSSMEMNLPDDDSAFADMSGLDKDIDAEIDGMILSRSSVSGGTAPSSSEQASSPDTDRFLGLLNS